MELGFIGVGKMGGGLAANLLLHGYVVKVYDVQASAVERLTALGAIAAASPAEAAAGVDGLFTSLPLPRDVETVLADQVLPTLTRPTTVLDVSTIDPITARTLKTRLAAKGHGFLACPLGKGPAQAAEGTEPIFCGGDRALFDRWEGILRQIGDPVYYLGDVEQSTAFKLVSNLIGLTNLAVLAEGLALGVRAGIPMTLLQTLLADTGAASYQLQLRGPWIEQGDYAPRFSVDLTLKDLRLAAQMAETFGMSAPLGHQAVALYAAAHDAGFGAEDAGAVFKLLAPKSE